MSEPFKGYENKLHGACAEITSGMNALRVEPEPIEPGPDAHDPPFLCDLDHFVKHSMDHFAQAYRLIVEYLEEVKND